MMKALLVRGLLLALCIPQMGVAGESTALEAPQGAALLEIRGDITQENALEGARFDFAMLKDLPQFGFDTSTPWTSGVSYYSGPLMRDLLERVGANSEVVRVAALNGYEAEIPVSDFYEYDVILALERNHAPMPIREYGPLWVLYPFDQDDTLLNEKMRFRAVWQVMRIDALK